MSAQISFLPPDKIEKSKRRRKSLRNSALYRLRDLGPQALTDAELLACLLQTPDALQRASDIVAKYDIWTVEPESIPDLTPGQVTRLRAALEIGRRFTAYQAPQRPTISHPGDIAALLMPLIGHQPQEQFVVIATNTRNHVLAVKILYTGTLDTSIVRIAEVIEVPMRHGAAGMIIAHSHPSGDPSPSPEDIALTRRIRTAAEMMQINLLDHIVIGHNRYVSLRERNLGFEDQGGYR